MDLKISDKAAQLAKEWVKGMSGGDKVDHEDADEVEIKTDGRPARLGLGAEYVPHSKLTTTLNPLEKKLKAKLNFPNGGAQGQHTKSYKRDRVAGTANSEKRLNDDSNSEDDTSRACQFNRKQKSAILNAVVEPSKGKKKRRKCG